MEGSGKMLVDQQMGMTKCGELLSLLMANFKEGMFKLRQHSVNCVTTFYSVSEAL